MGEKYRILHIPNDIDFTPLITGENVSTLPLRARPTGPLYPISSPAVYCKMYLTLIRRRYEALALSFRSGNRTLQFNVKLKRGYFKMINI